MCPFGALVSDRIPTADQPLVVRIGVAVLLVGAGQEEQGSARPESRVADRLGDPKHRRNRSCVVGRAVEPGVVVTREDDHLVGPVRAGDGPQDVVPDPAVVGPGELDIGRQRHRRRPRGDPRDQVVRGVPGDEDERNPVVVIRPVEAQQTVVTPVVEGSCCRCTRVEDHGQGALERRLVTVAVHPVVAERPVDEHDLPGGVHALVVAGLTQAQVEHLRRDPARRGTGHSTPRARGVRRATVDRDRCTVEDPAVDRDRKLGHMAQADRPHLVRDPVDRAQAGRRATGTPTVGRVTEPRDRLGDVSQIGNVDGRVETRRVAPPRPPRSFRRLGRRALPPGRESAQTDRQPPGPGGHRAASRDAVLDVVTQGSAHRLRFTEVCRIWSICAVPERQAEIAMVT